ncbi:MAG: class I SAM-dependent methyltransferase [Saprospiraceae bacterium]|nr:class I SAM-dependent methyltransferase [Saprospiraceae bacterium]
MRRFVFLLHYTWQWLAFYCRAKTIYNLQSPFLTELAQAVVEDRRRFYAFELVRGLRQIFAKDATPVTIQDIGAPSKVWSGSRRPISDIAKYNAISPAPGEMLFRLVNWLKPATMLELGTSLGLSAVYQSAAAPQARFVTVEGHAELAALARRTLGLAQLPQVEVLHDSFSHALATNLPSLQQLDYLFIDGDHRYEPTIEYVWQCLPYAHENSVFAIADIHWSAEMNRAWRHLQAIPEVSHSIDLFDIGLLFFRNGHLEKTHCSLIRYRHKPWRVGVF